MALFPLFSLCTKYWSLSCFVFFYYLTLCLRFVSVLLSQHLFPSYTLCVFSSLCVCLSGMVWLVLIYSHHYLVLGEDKHAFACLMNQTPPIPLSMRARTRSRQRARTHTGADVYIRVHTHAHAHTTGPAGLYLLVSDIESPAAANYSGKHGQSIAADRQKKP